MPPRLPLLISQRICCCRALPPSTTSQVASVSLPQPARSHSQPQPQPQPQPQYPFSFHQKRHAHTLLGSLSDTTGAYNKRIRRGRGPSSGKGKTSGRGHKGQKQHGKVPYRQNLGRHFEGGQTPLEFVHGSRGYVNQFSIELTPLNVDKLQAWIDAGRLDTSRPITVRELLLARCVSKVTDGVKLLARNKEALTSKVHIVVSRASGAAIEAVEKAGGSVQTRYYTQASMKRIVDGETHPTESLLSLPPPSTVAAAVGRPSREHSLSSQKSQATTNTAISTSLSPPSSSTTTNTYKYRLPDASSRKDLEYYRDPAHRGYLSYQVKPGQGPSLFFRTPAKVTARLTGKPVKSRKKVLDAKTKGGRSAGDSTGAGRVLTGAANRIW